MEKYVHISAASMRLQIDNQRMIAAGLANQNTVGFKRDFGNVASVYFDTNDDSDRVFPANGKSSVDLEAGKIIPTDNPLDVSIEGEGFFAGKTAAGDNVITRRGDFHVGTDSVLRNGENVAMEGDAGPITIPPNEYVTITHDGSVEVRPPGAETNAQPVVVGRLKLVKAASDSIQKGGDGLLRFINNVVPAADASISLNTKGLESSNVNSIDSMVEMLNSSRTFEIHVKLLATAKELDDQTARLMRPNQ